MAWLRRILGLKSRVRVVGTDLNGNQYIPGNTAWRYDSASLATLHRAYLWISLAGRRPRRMVKMADVFTEDQYTEDALPHEWERMYKNIVLNFSVKC